MQKSHSGLVLTFVAAALAGGPAWGQAAPASDPLAPAPGQTAADPSLESKPSPTGSALPDNAIADIVVTANKREQRERSVANSVTAISGQDLTRRNEVRLQDLVGQVPGLAIEDTSPTLSRIVLRGLNTGGVGSEVASVVDDVPINPENAQNNGAIATPNFDTYDLKRIEVLRGPQGTLYGATAEGGLIKYVTNPPELNKYSGSVESGIEGLTDGGIGGTLKGFVNIPLVPDKAALRISAVNEWIPGYIDAPQVGKTDSNSGQQYSYRGSLLVKPTEGLTVRLFASRQTVFANSDNFIQSVGAARTPLTPPGNQLSLHDGLRNNSRLPDLSHNEAGIYYADVNYDMGWANVASLTSYAFNNFKYRTDLSNTNVAAGLPYSDYLGSSAYGQPIVLGEPETLANNKFNQEVRLSSDPGTKLFGHGLDWQAGVFYTHETAGFQQDLEAFSTTDTSTLLAPAPGADATAASLAEWAVFGQVTYHITPAFSVDLGGRLAGTDQHAQITFFKGLLTGAATSYSPIIRSNDHDALYSVAPKLRIDSNTLAYARIATGYRPGGPNSPVPGVVGLPTSYTPDRTVNYEIGIRRDLFDKKVQADVTGFLVNWKSVQVLTNVDTPSGVFNVEGNAGTATSKGVEWSLGWQVMPGLKVTAAGAYTDARLTSEAPGIGATNGEYLPFVPNVTNSVNVDYSWNVFGDYEGYVSGTWTYVGERYTGFSSVQSVVTPHVLLPSYNTGSLRAGIENDRYGFEAFINNISDERGITTYANTGGANQTGLLTLIEPRLFGATLRVKF